MRRRSIVPWARSPTRTFGRSSRAGCRQASYARLGRPCAGRRSRPLKSCVWNGEVLRYSRGSKETGIGKGEYARVMGIDARHNRITVALKDGTERTYDPHRQQGVSVYCEEPRSFSTGDRIQFTAPTNDLKVANRELGTVQSITEGRMSLRMDDVAHWCDNGEVAVDPRPSRAQDAAIAAVNGVLKPVFDKLSNSRPGELALQAMIRQTHQLSQQAAPHFIPVLLFLHGDRTGAPPGEIDKLLVETLENSSMLYVLNDGAVQGWGGSLLGMELSHVLRYLAEQTGGAAMIANWQNPESYSEALAAILDRLHGRYQIGFVPRTLDGKAHKIKVQLTAEARKSNPHLLLKERAEYRAPFRLIRAEQAGSG